MQNFLYLDIIQSSPLVQEVFDTLHKTKRIIKEAEKEETEFYASFPITKIFCLAQKNGGGSWFWNGILSTSTNSLRLSGHAIRVSQKR
nr:hypothetical protein MarFTME_366 [Marseillevirus futianmevirus]